MNGHEYSINVVFVGVADVEDMYQMGCSACEANLKLAKEKGWRVIFRPDTRDILGVEAV